MRLIFMGTPDFAVPSLKILLDNGYDVVGVITSTDKYGGRGQKQLIESAVKKFSKEKGLNILQPKNLKSPKFGKVLKALNADLQVVVAFRMLPVVVWDMPPLGTINLHASLLPKYRGAAPINWAVIKGEEQTGLTTFQLQHEIDTGNILYQHTMPIGPDETAGELHDRMMEAGAKLVLKTVNAIADGTAKPRLQDDTLVTKAPKIHTETCQVDFEQDIDSVYNLIRGLSPYPLAWTTIDGQMVKIYSARKESADSKVPGSIETNQKDQLYIHCKNGKLAIEELKMAGKRKMKVNDFLNGYEIKSLSTEWQQS